MKKILALSLFAMLFSGCCSYTEIGRPATALMTDGSETVLANVTVFNISYSILGLLPFESGTTWKEGPYEDRETWNATFFSDHCTIDENLASLKAALKEVGSNKVVNLVTESDSWRWWSLFLVKRTVMKTSCTVLK